MKVFGNPTKGIERSKSQMGSESRREKNPTKGIERNHVGVSIGSDLIRTLQRELKVAISISSAPEIR